MARCVFRTLRSGRGSIRRWMRVSRALLLVAVERPMARIGVEHRGVIVGGSTHAIRIATLRVRHGGLTRATSDLDDSRPDGKLSQYDKIIEDLRRMGRPGPFVELRHLLEGRCQNLLGGPRHETDAMPGRTR